ncbi:uncharacterized protein N7482_001530 [Penicillium canariense]|uniref:Uncharacterized protein n=1 Tax=Penicillium canariense TaxID=189055 RepID=A0A9W9LT15_9EURO|nr:uncharacterized protein N7482_001530 [Penicillium canariense]KAJ5175653.1 hypothetical protein N7482_001530 [Penicillium canariense]
MDLMVSLRQCIILATRPILLYTLIQSRDASHADKNTTQAHVQTPKTLMDQQIAADLRVLRRPPPRLYLFSVALIMVLSSQIHEHRSDYGLFETALEILRAMSNHGNLAAPEFYNNLECVQQCLDQKWGSTTRTSHASESSRVLDSQPMRCLRFPSLHNERPTSDRGGSARRLYAARDYCARESHP